MLDHGANSTPVWITMANAVFRWSKASDVSLGVGAMLDPLLLVLTFAAIGYTFGLRAMFVCMVIFGANDFYMLGSNWAGATLRHDWLAFLGLGACALGKKRYAAGGALLTLAASVRAFPAFAVFGLTFPALWWAGEFAWNERRLPKWSEIVKEQRPALLAVAGRGRLHRGLAAGHVDRLRVRFVAGLVPEGGPARQRPGLESGEPARAAGRTGYGNLRSGAQRARDSGDRGACWHHVPLCS